MLYSSHFNINWNSVWGAKLKKGSLLKKMWGRQWQTTSLILPSRNFRFWRVIWLMHSNFMPVPLFSLFTAGIWLVPFRICLFSQTSLRAENPNIYLLSFSPQNLLTELKLIKSHKNFVKNFPEAPLMLK